MRALTTPERQAILDLGHFALAAYLPDRGFSLLDVQYRLSDYEIKLITKGNTTIIVGVREDRMVVAFAGSNDFWDWLRNLQSLSGHPYPELESRTFVGKGFHKNIYLVLSAVVDEITSFQTKFPEGTLLLTGHSAGAAAATLLADHLNRINKRWNTLVTFESPRVFCPELARVFDRYRKERGHLSLRVTYGVDPVPHLPVGLRFRHIGEEVWIPKNPEKSAIVSPSIWRKIYQTFRTLRLFRSYQDHYMETIYNRLRSL